MVKKLFSRRRRLCKSIKRFVLSKMRNHTQSVGCVELGGHEALFPIECIIIITHRVYSRGVKGG